MAEGKGIEPLSVRIARGSSPLCHLDATFCILAESSVIETHAKRHSLFSKQAYHLDSLLSLLLIGNVRIVALTCPFEGSHVLMIFTMSRMDSTNNRILAQNSTTGNMAHLHW